MARESNLMSESPISSMAKMRAKLEKAELECKATDHMVEEPLHSEFNGLAFFSDEVRDGAERWICAHEGFISSLCKKYLWIDEFDELFQIACLSVLKAYDRYDPHQRDVKRSTFFYHCMENGIMHHGRAMKAQKRTFTPDKAFEFHGKTVRERDEDGVLAITTGSAEDSLLESESTQFWLQAINTLPEKQREVLVWTMQGRTQMEIKDIMHCSQASVSGWLKEARKTLEKLRKVVA